MLSLDAHGRFGVGSGEGDHVTFGRVGNGRENAQCQERPELQRVVRVDDRAAYGRDEVDVRIERLERSHFTKQLPLSHGRDEVVALPLVLVAIDDTALLGPLDPASALNP